MLNFCEDDRVLIGNTNGCLFEYSIKEKRIIHNFGKISNSEIFTIIMTPNKKSFFVSDYSGTIYQFDTISRK